MRVLVACEFSGTVRNAFLDRGHDAWSCDLLPTEKPGPHITGDVLSILGEGWDLMIAHPPCKYLTGSAEWAYSDGPYHQKLKPETLVGEARRQARKEAISFVRRLWESPIPKICIENPVGVLTRELGLRPQIIQPYQFGDDASKATCLWLKNIPNLIPLPQEQQAEPRIVFDISGRKQRRWANQTNGGQNKLTPSSTREQDRSRTFQGIADAFASQWG